YQSRRHERVTSAGHQFMRRPVGLGGGRVVVGGRGLVAERGEQPGPFGRRKLAGQVAHRPPVQFEGLAVGGNRRRLTRGGDRVLVREFVTLCLLEVRRDERAAVPAVHRGPRHPFVQAAPGGQV